MMKHTKSLRIINIVLILGFFNYNANACPINCMTCGADTTKCTICNPGYTVVNDLCVACHENCNVCNTNGADKCDDQAGCITGYTFDAATMTCTPPACSQPNCDVCNTPPTCDRCAKDYTPGVTSGCDACRTTITDCRTCDRAMRKCIQCIGANGVVAATGLCAPCSANCRSCPISGAAKCDTCLAGFSTDGSQLCVGCDSSAGGTNCDTCDTTTSPPTCTKCKNGFGFDAGDITGACVACTDTQCSNCLDNANMCVNCKTGFALDATTSTCKACAANCGRCNTAGPGKCDPGFCNAGYGITGTDTCGACDPNCNNCATNGAGKCDTGRCVTGYTFDAATMTCEGTCASPNCDLCATPPVCDRCSVDFTPGVTDGCDACRTTITNCRTCDQEIRKCTLCIGANGVDATGMCAPCSGNCRSCPISGAAKCDTCLAGFSIASDGSQLCVGCAASTGGTNCDTCDTNPSPPTCTKCKNGFGFDAGVVTGLCVACVDTNCQNCLDNANTCVLCKNGFGLDATSSCGDCDPNCFRCVTNGAGKCDDGFCHAGYEFDTATQTCELPVTGDTTTTTTPSDTTITRDGTETTTTVAPPLSMDTTTPDDAPTAVTTMPPVTPDPDVSSVIPDDISTSAAVISDSTSTETASAPTTSSNAGDTGTIVGISLGAAAGAVIFGCILYNLLGRVRAPSAGIPRPPPPVVLPPRVVVQPVIIRGRGVPVVPRGRPRGVRTYPNYMRRGRF